MRGANHGAGRKRQGSRQDGVGYIVLSRSYQTPCHVLRLAIVVQTSQRAIIVMTNNTKLP